MSFHNLQFDIPLTVHYVRVIELGVIPFNSGRAAAILLDVIFYVPALIFIKHSKHCMLLPICLFLEDNQQSTIAFYEQRHLLKYSILLSYLLCKQRQLQQSCGKCDSRGQWKGVEGQDFRMTVQQPAWGGAPSETLALLTYRWYATGQFVKGPAFWFDLSISFWHFFLQSNAPVFASKISMNGK